MNFKNHVEKAAAEYHIGDVGLNTLIAPNFRAKELACNDGNGRFLAHPATLVLLEKIREHFNRPVIINSFYRTPKYNQEIGGSNNSRHLYGMAADIYIRNISPEEIYDYADSLDIGGLGIYDSFVHLDVWKEGRRWDNRS